MKKTITGTLCLAASLALAALVTRQTSAQPADSYRLVEDWASLPSGVAIHVAHRELNIGVGGADRGFSRGRCGGAIIGLAGRTSGKLMKTIVRGAQRILDLGARGQRQQGGEKHNRGFFSPG